MIDSIQFTAIGRFGVKSSCVGPPDFLFLDRSAVELAHDLARLSRESALTLPEHRQADFCQRMARPREGENVVPDVFGCVHFDQKAFLARCGMIRQGAVSKAVLAARIRFFDHIYDPARVQIPNAQGVRDNCNGISFADRCVSRQRGHPAQLKLLLLFYRAGGGIEDAVSSTKLNPRMADKVIWRWTGGRRADVVIRKIERILLL